MFIAITFDFVTLPKVFANTINVTREITALVDKVWKLSQSAILLNFINF